MHAQRTTLAAHGFRIAPNSPWPAVPVLPPPPVAYSGFLLKWLPLPLQPPRLPPAPDATWRAAFLTMHGHLHREWFRVLER